MSANRSTTWRCLVTTACAILIAAYATASLAQPRRTFEELRSALDQARSDEALQVRARWVLDRPVGNPARATNRFEVVSAERVSAALAPDRRPQVNSQSIVVVSETAAGRELDWRIVPDPRVVRAESAEGDKLTGDTLYYSTAELLLPAVHLPVWIDRHDGRGVPLRRRAQKAW